MLRLANSLEAVRALHARLTTWRRRARSRAELAAMDDRMLGDLGLSRGAAYFEASKPFWRG
jgi:uncharacterized protein YjiS (DUF1127 family)